MRIVEELDYETKNEINDELEDILNRHPNNYGFDVDDEETKFYVKNLLEEKGYKVKVSGNYKKYHIEYFKKELNESNAAKVKRVLFGDLKYRVKTFAIISPENPLGKQLTPEENNKRVERFKKQLKQNRYKYKKVLGKYGNEEHSFIIFNIRYQDVLDYAKEYEQESFFYGELDFREDSKPTMSISYYFTSNKCKTYTLKETKKSNVIDSDEHFKDFFTQIGNFKFNIGLDIFKEGLETTDMNEILLSLEEDRTKHSSYLHRCFGYRKKD